MKKIIILFFMLIIVSICSLFFGAKDANAVTLYANWGSNNSGNIIWQVGYRVCNACGTGNETLGTTYTQLANRHTNSYNRNGGDTLYPNGSKPVGFQWSTGCIDPRVSATSFPQAEDPNSYSATANITFSSSNLNNLGFSPSDPIRNYLDDINWYENHGGKTIWFSGTFNVPNCPKKPCIPDNSCSSNQCGTVYAGCPGDYKDCKGCPYGNQTCNSGKCVGHFSCDHSTGNCAGDINGNSTDQFACSTSCIRYAPDLDITEFTYPGGQQGDSVQAKVKVINRGHYDVKNNFNIKIDNGINSNPHQQILTVNINNTPLKAGGPAQTFTFPPTTLVNSLGDHFANALANSDGGVPYEEGKQPDGDSPNDARDKYNIKLNTVDIGGHVYLDTNLNGTLDSGIDPPYSVKLTGNNKGSGGAFGLVVTLKSGARQDTVDANTGAFNITGNPQNNPYTIKIDTTTLMPGESVRIPASPGEIDVNAGTTDITGKNFLVTPAKFSIDVGAILDTDPVYGHKNTTSDPAPGNVNESFFPDNITVNLQGPNQPASGTNATINSGSNATFTGLVVDSDFYTISFLDSSISSGYKNVYPNGTTFSPIRIGRGTNNCQFTLGTFTQATCTNGNLSNLLFGFQDKSSPWFQATGGDVRQSAGVTNSNSATSVNSCSNASTPTSYTTAENSTNLKDPGIVYNGANTDLTKTNKNNWVVKNSSYNSRVRTSYSSLYNTLITAGKLGATDMTSKCGGNLASCNLGGFNGNRGIYTAASDVTITAGTTFTAGNNYIFLIDGNLTINDNITVDPGATVIFAVKSNATGDKGNITVAPNVANIQGFYSAENNFIVNSLNTEVDDKLLTIEGSVVTGANKKGGNLYNYRDLGASQVSGSKVCPSLNFKFRPDFILYAPEAIKSTNTSIREVNASSPALPVAPTGPTVTLTSAAAVVDYGTKATLRWSTTNALSCTGTGFTPDGTNNSTGVQSTNVLTGDTTFTINCKGIGGNISANTTVKVKPRINYFSLVNTPILSGTPATLKWSSDNAVNCKGTNFNTGATSPVSSTGVSTPNVSANTTYTLTCTSASGTTNTDTISLNSTSAYTEESNNTVTIEVENSSARTKSDNGSAKTWAFNNSSSLNTFYGSGYMAAQTDTGAIITSGYPSNSPVMSYLVNFTSAGDYIFLNRSAAPDAGGDTIAVGVDNGVQDDAKIYIKDSAGSVWRWKNDNIAGSATSITIPDKGLHTINIWMREDGARIDRISLNKVGNPSVTFVDNSVKGPAESSIDTYFE